MLIMEDVVMEDNLLWRPRAIGNAGRSTQPESMMLETGCVSPIHGCQSEAAKKLCIYDIAAKIKHHDIYDIGGTCTGNESDLWFYYSTSMGPGYNIFLNLFVCHRKVGNFSIGVSDSNELVNIDSPKEESSGFISFPNNLTWHTFKSAQPNEDFYIKTFCLTRETKISLKMKTLVIPINIVMNSSQTFISNEIIKSIKLRHDLSGLIAKKEKTDFTLVSESGKKYPVHKIILMAHSPILKNLVKDTQHELFIDIQDCDMELLVQFLYTGTVKDFNKLDCMNILGIADRFELRNLFLLAQYALDEQINVDSAVEIALLAQKYDLEGLRKKVFHYIKNNPKVMQTKSWLELSNVELMKQLVEHVYLGTADVVG